MREVVLIRAGSAAAVRDVVERAERLLEQRRPGSRVQKFTDGPGGVALLQSEPAGWQPSVALHEAGREAFTYSGIVSLPDPAASRVRELLDIRRRWWGRGRPTVRLRSSPGGMAAFFLADGAASTCLAWSGLPGMEAVFHTSGSRAVVLSNSPLLSHLIGLEREEAALSRTWARRTLLADATLWDDTPYEDTCYARPRSALLVDRDGVHHLPHPLSLDGERGDSRSPEAIDRMVETTLAALAPLRELPAAELNLSGGKDSRYLAALVALGGIPVECTTYGSPGPGQGGVAARIAGILGLPHRFCDQRMGHGPDLLPTMVANLRRSEGMLNENRQLAYVYQPRPGVPWMQGHAHHARGAFNTGMLRKSGEVRRLMHRYFIGDETLLDPDISAERAARIEQLVDGYRVQFPADLSYWMYADWRMSRWLQPGYFAMARERPLLWPLMDERFLVECARFDPGDRISEYSFFAALMKLAPGLAPVPLYQDIWKFDRGGEAGNPFPEGFAGRMTPVAEPQGPKAPEKRMATVLPVFRMVMSDLRCSGELRGWIRPKVLSPLLDGGDTAVAVGVDHQRLIRFMWKAAAVGLVLDGQHLQPATGSG